MARVLVALSLLFSVTAFARDLDKLYEKATFRLGKTQLHAYVADNNERRRDGLMFISNLPTDTGMLFVFEDLQPLGFWMKNTLIPLSIGYFDAKGVLQEVLEMKVASSLMNLSPPTYPSRGLGLFALEMNAGWFSKKGIKPGAKLELVSKSKSTLLNKHLPARR